MKLKILIVSFLTFGSLQAQNTDFILELEDFTALEVYNGINVNLVKGDKNEAKVSLKDLSRERLLVENENGVLSFRISDALFDTYQVNMVLTYKEVPVSISALSESDVMQESIFQADSISLTARTNANLTFYLNVKKASVKALEGSGITLKGFTDELNAESHTNATLEAFGLEAENARLEASMKGRVKITVNQSIDAYANINGYIGYKGNPKKETSKKKLGGTIDKL